MNNNLTPTPDQDTEIPSFQDINPEEVLAISDIDSPLKDSILEEDQPILVEEEPAKPVIKVKKKHRVQIKRFDRPVTEDDNDAFILNLPPDSEENIKESLNGTPNLPENDPVLSEWVSCLVDSSDKGLYLDILDPVLSDEDSNFVQDIEINSSPYGIRTPKVAKIEGQELKGEKAAIVALNELGYNIYRQIPLWHSGLWITFSQPKDPEILQLRELLAQDKISFGRKSYGLFFSNNLCYTYDRLIEFAFNHIHSISVDLRANVKTSNIKTILRTIISSQDIPTIILGIAATMYPDGFKYRRACIKDPGKCSHVLERMINIEDLIVTNEMALTPWQKAHMAYSSPNSRTMEDVKRYQEELVKLSDQKITLKRKTGQISVILKNPSIAEYIGRGQKWIAEMISIADTTLGMEADREARNQFIVDQAKASVMRQYAHLCRSIEVGSNIIEDPDSIDRTLNALSTDEDLWKSYMNQTYKFINHSMISVIGIKRYECPMCNAEPETLQYEPFTNYVPLDVVQLFFGLLLQKLEKIKSRR